MIIRKLPPPAHFSASDRKGVFEEHTLFTETISQCHEYPQHIAGAGILAMLCGQGEFLLNGKKDRLDNESFLVINRGSRLSMSFLQTDARPVLLFFQTRLADRLWTEKADFSYLERLHSLEPTFRERLEWLARLNDSCSSFGALKADSIVRSMLDVISAKAASAIQESARLPVVRNGTRIDLFKKLSFTRDWIAENFACSITLREMAGIATLNPQHFLRMFRDCYGITPHRFLVEVRLEKARQLLINSTENISSVCLQTGFESVSSFSGLFRERAGLPPSEYRRRYQLRK